jgi:hypothetical protein
MNAMLPRDIHFIALGLPDRNAHTAIPDIVDLGNGHYVSRTLPGVLPDHWRESLGARTFDATPNAGLFLIVTTEGTGLDQKPGHLARRRFRFQLGLQVAVPYLSYGPPIWLSGHTENREDPRYNGYNTYSRTWPTAAHPLTEVTVSRLKQARAFGEAIERQTMEKSWSRNRPVLSAFRRATESFYLDERIHDLSALPRASWIQVRGLAASSSRIGRKK